jgi:hypothetical protein
LLIEHDILAVVRLDDSRFHIVSHYIIGGVDMSHEGYRWVPCARYWKKSCNDHPVCIDLNVVDAEGLQFVDEQIQQIPLTVVEGCLTATAWSSLMVSMAA